MVARNKIDSNDTGLSIAEEVELGKLDPNPANVNWYGLEPNGYDDFGGELTLLARNPINASRQRKKGAITDLDASGGFNQDFTQINTQNVLQGVMFADYREKPTFAIDTVTATGFTTADDITGVIGNMLMYASGFSTPANNGLHVVSAAASGEISAPGLTAEALAPIGAKLILVGFRTAAGDLDVTVTGGAVNLSTTAFDLTRLNLIPGEWFYIGGDLTANQFTTVANNGFKRAVSITAHNIRIDQSVAIGMATEANSAKLVDIFIPARVLKNELEELIKRRSYQLERRLGVPDTASTNRQAEYLIGAVPDQFKLNTEMADKLNADISFVAIDNDQRTQTQGVKAGNRVPLVESDLFNTSTDIVAMRLSVYDSANAAPTALFGYLTSFNLTINNNLSVNKAVAILGGFDITAGMFEVSAEAEAYFSTVEAVQAVRQNANVQMFMAFVKNNGSNMAGFIIDIPLIALGNARLNVEQNEPIKLPLTIDAATAALLNPALDHTLFWSFFDYLPNAARQKG